MKKAAVLFLTALLFLPLAAGAGTDAQIKLEQAKVQFSEKDYTGALELLQAVIAEEPDNAEAYQYAGLCQMAQGKPSEAAPYFEKAAALTPNNAGALTDLAWAKYEAGDFAGALDASQKALAIDPASDRALFYKGAALLGLERCEEALVVFKDLAGRSETYKQAALYHAGVCLLKLGRTEEAKAHFQQAVDAGPETPLGIEAAKFVKALGGEGEQPKTKTAPYGVKFRLLYQYDTNLVPVNDDTYLPEDVSNMEDGRGVIDLDAHYNFINTDSGKAQVRYLGYASFHSREDEVNLLYNLLELSGYSDFPMGTGKVRLLAAANYAMSNLGGDPYSNNWRTTVGAGFYGNEFLLTRFTGEYFGEAFDDPGEDALNRDNAGWQATVYQHFFLFNGKLNTWIGYRYGQIGAEGDEYNRVDNVGLAGLVAALPGKSLLYLLYRYEERDYPDSSFGREEKRNIANLAFQTPVYQSVSLYASVIYTGVDANLDFLEYERWIYSGGFMIEL